MRQHDPPQAAVGLGVVAGVAGTAVMTAFQKFIEMPITGREESYAPANFAAKILPIEPKDEPERQRLNRVTHFALGAMWGTAFGLAGRAGLHGQKAVAAVFATVYTGDVLLNTALGLYQPSSWSGRELAIDVIDKLVQAEATGAIFDRMTATSCLGGWHRSSAVTRSRRAASALGRRAIKLHQPEAE